MDSLHNKSLFKLSRDIYHFEVQGEVDQQFENSATLEIWSIATRTRIRTDFRDDGRMNYRELQNCYNSSLCR
jgi:hypothetical protein